MPTTEELLARLGARDGLFLREEARLEEAIKMVRMQLDKFTGRLGKMQRIRQFVREETEHFIRDEQSPLIEANITDFGGLPEERKT